MDEKEELLAKFKEIKGDVDNLDKLEDEFLENEEKIEKLSHFPKAGKIYSFFGILIALAGILLTPMALIEEGDFSGLFLIIFAIYPIKKLIFDKKKIKELQKQNSILQADMTLIKNSQDFSFIPSNYRNATDIQKFQEYLEQGRADSLKEAINLFETELHQRRIEIANNIL